MVSIVFRKKFSVVEGLALMSYFFIPVTAAIVQNFIYGLCITNMAVTMSLLLMFLVYERSRTDKIMQQAKEIVEQEKARNDWELSTLRAQVQPHFIFNCMTTIQVLCRKDPKLAAEAIEKFSRFLRCTIDAYDKKECVSWDDEMFITNNFIFLEKTRFGSWLNVEKNIEAENFFLPAL
jgi:LytS/YehU family sensor histidine kinase